MATSFGVIFRGSPHRQCRSATWHLHHVRPGPEQARDTLRSDQLLALAAEDTSALPSGEDVAEPVYGAPARDQEAQRETAALTGSTIVTPAEVLATHL